ncbi:MAG: TrpB-like pyridoxal phosphate-dependent enzyme [Candidatus Hydrogenedentes bacterium]|nr:TrpB-like pyridoxal phosphate-dependent enzyme [Candidatus Hydrogenedentota bacterium]
MSEQTKIFLDESEMPKQWYNVIPDMPVPPPPPLHPGTGQPVGPDDLSPLFPMALIEQEVSSQPWIDIPEEILDVYSLWRPSPLVRAHRFEKALDTPAKIYFKNESVSGPGSHKPNTAVAQAYYNKEEGIAKISTETGAGQWGSALSFACNLFGIECVVYMVKASYEQKPYRRVLMEIWGSRVVPSPSSETNAGKAVLAEDPECPGSLGIAISEAVEVAATHDDTKYSLGSVLNHVLLHQTIIGLETKAQLAKVGAEPDIVVGCVGGGSNYAGLAFPFVADKASGKDIRFVAVEPTACPTMTRGPYRYDFGDKAQTTPLLKMHTLGHDFVPASIHSGGLRYHGMAPLVSALVNSGIIEAKAYHQNSAFESAILFARTEGIIPAPETSHAIKAVVEEAKQCTEEGKEKTIVFNFSGHGHFDLAAYDAYLSGELKDYEYPENQIKESLSKLPDFG